MSFRIFDLPIDHLSTQQWQEVVRGWMHKPVKRLIVTPNAEMLLAAKKDHRLEAALQESHLALPDATSLRFAIAAQYGRDAGFFKHPGTDVLQDLVRIAAEEGKSVLFVGGAGDSASQAAGEMKRRHPHLRISAVNPGKVSYTEGRVELPEELKQSILAWQPEILAFGLGHGKQEVALATHLSAFPTVKIGIGVGGAFEMIDGKLRRAPEAWRKMGLEWLWRLVLEPTRIGRIYKATVVFPTHVAYDAWRDKRFIFALQQVFPEIIQQIRGK